MNIEFHAGDALAFLSSKMEMVILDLQLAELPFKRRGSYAQIGERAHHHIAADPGEAIEVKNRLVRADLTGKATRAAASAHPVAAG
jgi:hypothetical protein